MENPRTLSPEEAKELPRFTFSQFSWMSNFGLKPYDPTKQFHGEVLENNPDGTSTITRLYDLDGNWVSGELGTITCLPVKE
ncbi:MAG: hypothetical protein WC777_03390 [Candidatus Gracilibacteria bacterium]|jgi:hypothetical protein